MDIKSKFEQIKVGAAEVSEKKNWYSDRYQRTLVQRNILVLVTFAALVAVFISTIAVSRLTPLKSVQPFLIQVDEKTGATQVVDPVKSTEITGSESVKQFFVTHYIRSRENYDATLFNINYEPVRLMSSQSVFGEYRQFYNPNNEASPLARFGNEYKRMVDFKSLTFLAPNLAQVRLTVTETSKNNRSVTHYIALMQFEFAKLELKLQERYINPLGFIVNSYKLEPEMIGQ